MKTFLITEEEKNRILGMHKEATKRHYLGEQGTDPKTQPANVDKAKIYNENIAKINSFFPAGLATIREILTKINQSGLTEMQIFDIAQPWIEKNGVTIKLITNSDTIPNEGRDYTSRFKTETQVNSSGNYKSAVKLVLEDARDLYYALVAKAQEAKGGILPKYPEFFTSVNGKDVLNGYVTKVGLTV